MELRPVLKDFRDKVNQTINGLSDWLDDIDGVVDSTILYSTWAEEALLHIGSDTSTDKVRGEFLELIEKVGAQITEIDVAARRSDRRCTTMKNIRDRLALVTLKDKAGLQKQKLDQASYWDEMLRTYEAKIGNRPVHMYMCTHFYHHIDQALLIQSTTRTKIDQMKSQISALTDGIKNAPLDNRKQGSLRLYVDVFKGGVESLREKKVTNFNVRARKRREIEAIKVDFET
jgi:uncharacterized protein YlaI